MGVVGNKITNMEKHKHKADTSIEVSEVSQVDTQICASEVSQDAPESKVIYNPTTRPLHSPVMNVGPDKHLLNGGVIEREI